MNVRSAQADARDVSMQSSMHQVRNAAEMSYTKNSESYFEVCDENDDTLSNVGEFANLEAAIKKENGGKDVKCFESADQKSFAASSPMVAKPGKYWCVESAGLSIEIANPITSATCQ